MVLNGLLSRDNQKEEVSIPIGIIPAGSDNSLVWTVLGVRDPISATISIVKVMLLGIQDEGGLTAIDVFAVEWIRTGVIHFGMTVSYYGFVSDVLELSEKYQKRFGPLQYFVAGFLKLLCLPKYNYEVEYLLAAKEDQEGKISTHKEVVDMSDLYTDIMRRSNKNGIPRASSLSSIDSIMTPNLVSIGPIWDAEPKWDPEANWDKENPIELPGLQNDVDSGIKKEVAPRFEDKWIVTKGPFLGILVCKHACRTVQSSQVVAPKAEHDDNTMDILLVHGSGQLRLIRFFLLLQMGKHLSLPYVEYVKVKSVKIKAGKHTHNSCGIDGEFFPLHGEVVSSLLPEQ
ncbi:Sphingoid long-chain bases kinase 1 [Hibiscus syriacus]|uniref:Sphingoid long-chain bases kinase 1 n=1 Tax=Hibiscus syriacus TaxID=106335 RepID=A0A6A2ZJI0_HIBSY|nr:Sphingoid long-chain bases kinase 1 [Hibiscus syriacus]